MSKIYISLGADCGTAQALKAVGKKTLSFPMDNLVCFRSVYKLFENDFRGFLENRIVRRDIGAELNMDYHLRFFHRELISDYDNTIQRRVDRLLNLLRTDTENELVFIRRTHDQKHHPEMIRCGFPPIQIDDVGDMVRLDEILKEKYPNLKYTINVCLQCPICHSHYPDSFVLGNVKFFKSKSLYNPNHNEAPHNQVYIDWVNTL